MTDERQQRKLEALHRLMREGHKGGIAKVDALVALTQLEVFVPIQRPGSASLRTLLSSRGDKGLPIFTTLEAFRVGAHRFGWTVPTGEDLCQQINARAALRSAAEQRLNYIVVDVGSAQELEIEEKEIEPLLSDRAQRDSLGPFGAVIRYNRSSLLPPPSSVPPPNPHASSSRPAIPSAAADAPPADIVAAARESSIPADPFAAIAGTGGGSEVGAVEAAPKVSSLSEAPSDTLAASLSTALSAYPEVEWATLFGSARNPKKILPTLGLRIDPSFRPRVAEILASARSAGEKVGVLLDTVLLDDQQLLRQARSVGTAIYPWRRRT